MNYEEKLFHEIKEISNEINELKDYKLEIEHNIMIAKRKKEELLKKYIKFSFKEKSKR